MCAFSAPKVAPVTLPPAPVTEQVDTTVDASDPNIAASKENERRRRLLSAQGNDTLVNGAQGLTAPASTGGAQFLGA